jgi:hypothetical protein
MKVTIMTGLFAKRDVDVDTGHFQLKAISEKLKVISK